MVVAVPPGGCGMASSLAQRVPALSILGQVDRRRARAEDELGRKGPGQLERCLAAERHDHPRHLAARRHLGVEHVGDVLIGQRLEVQPVRRVVVGRNGLGVAVDHDRLVAGVAQRHGGVDAAVVELDALADPVWARAEDDDPRPLRRADLVLLLVGRVVVGREGLELGGAGVDGLEGGPHAAGQPVGPDVRSACVPRRKASCASEKPSRLARR